MNNLMDTIPKWAQEDSSSDGGGDDIETPSKQPTTDYMEDFFRHVDSIKADIDAVAKATNDIAKISEQSMRATTTEDENKLSKKLKPLIDSTNQRAKKSKNMLGLLKEDTVSLKTAGKLNASDIR
jgi:ABC-type proline/glycine betaine transport system ATPase subunit